MSTQNNLVIGIRSAKLVYVPRYTNHVLTHINIEPNTNTKLVSKNK
jgi:hypothetical protein